MALPNDTADWAIVADGGVADRFATKNDAKFALGRGGYPTDAEVKKLPEDERDFS